MINRGYAICAAIAALGLASCKEGHARLYDRDPSLPENLPFSSAVMTGDVIYLSGELGRAPGTTTLVDGGVGADLSDNVKCTAFLDDISQFNAMNAACAAIFPDDKPARSTVGVDGLALGAAIILSAAGANAQESDQPIPPWGGAIKYAGEESAALPGPLEAGWKGEKVCEPLFENAHLRAARCTFPPGVGHERHYHRPHFGYIVEGGTMQITDGAGTREQETPAGGTWWSDGVEWRETVNIGETKTVYVIVEPKSAAKE